MGVILVAIPVPWMLWVSSVVEGTVGYALLHASPGPVGSWGAREEARPRLVSVYSRMSSKSIKYM